MNNSATLPTHCPVPSLQPFVAPNSDKHLDVSHPADFPLRTPHPCPVSAPSFSHTHPWAQCPPHHSPSGQVSGVPLQPLGGATQHSLCPETTAAAASVWSRLTGGRTICSIVSHSVHHVVMRCRDANDVSFLL